MQQNNRLVRGECELLLSLAFTGIAITSRLRCTFAVFRKCALHTR